MAITFITTVGATDSNSYTTVEEFNTYIEKLVNVDDIPKSSQTTLIRKLLIAGTEAVDELLSNSMGYVTSTTQRLEFPRVGIIDRRGNSIADDILPQELKEAVSEMAIYLFQNNLNNAQHDSWEDDLSSVAVGGAMSFNYDADSKPANMIPERVKFLLTYIGTAYAPKVNRVWRS